MGTANMIFSHYDIFIVKKEWCKIKKLLQISVHSCVLTGKNNKRLLLLKTFCSSWAKGSQPNSKDVRKSTRVMFQRVGVVVVYVCVCGGEGVEGE